MLLQGNNLGTGEEKRLMPPTSEGESGRLIDTVYV